MAYKLKQMLAVRSHLCSMNRKSPSLISNPQEPVNGADGFLSSLDINVDFTEEVNIQEEIQEKIRLQDIEADDEEEQISYKESDQIKIFERPQFQAFEHSQKKNLEILKEINTGIRQGDYRYLFKRQEQLDKLLRVVGANWKFNRLIYEPHVKKLMNLVKAKLEYVSEARLVYERIFNLMKYLEKLLDYQGNRREAICRDQITDSLYQHSIKELQERLTKNGVYVIKQNNKSEIKILLSDYIANYPEFMEQEWREIFSITANHINERDNKIPRTPFLYSPYIQPPSYDCLGCTKYFNVNENIYYPERLKGLLVLGGSCMQLEINKTSIIEQICGLLNGGGGVMLFNTSKVNNTVLARGEYVTQLQKEKIEQFLVDLISNSIHPKPQLSKNIFINWVPMVNPSSTGNERRPYVEGLFVGRVIVKPTEELTYYWNQEDNIFFTVREKSLQGKQYKGKRMLKGEEIVRFLKAKFNKFNGQSKEKDESLDVHLQKLQQPMQHTCPDPEGGCPITEKKKEIQSPQSIEYEKFKYASIIAAKKSDYSMIQANLKKYNIDSVIRAPFQTLRFKGSSSSAILYHNTRFDQLFAVVNYNKDFQINNKYLLVISITNYIKLTDRNKLNKLNKQDLDGLENWLSLKFPKEVLRGWELTLENNEVQYYVSTESLTSSYYIYMVMVQFDEKCQFKNPKSLDRMTAAERSKRFKQIYPIA